MTKFRQADTLIVVALEAELSNDLLPDWRIVYSGVGKINATMALCDAIIKFKQRTVVTHGTAVSL